MNLTATTQPGSHLRPIERFTPLAGPVTLCDGLSLPFAFETVDGTTWTMQSHDLGQTELEASNSTTGWTEEGDPLASRTWVAPLVVESPDVETQLTVPEAHDVALERSGASRGLFSNGTDPLVVSTYHHREGRAWVDLGVSLSTFEEHKVIRGLTAMTTDGQEVSLEVVKRIREIAGTEQPVYIEDPYETRSQSGGEISKPPMLSTLVRQQSAMLDALQEGRSLTQQPAELEAGHGMVATLPGQPWDHATNSLRQHGYTVGSYHEDPSPIAPGVKAPYQAVFDGPSGATLWVVADNRTLRP